MTMPPIPLCSPAVLSRECSQPARRERGRVRGGGRQGSPVSHWDTLDKGLKNGRTKILSQWNNLRQARTKNRKLRQNKNTHAHTHTQIHTYTKIYTPAHTLGKLDKNKVKIYAKQRQKNLLGRKIETQYKSTLDKEFVDREGQQGPTGRLEYFC